MMAQPTAAKRRAWLKRAATILRKAEELQADAMRAVGEEHEITDYIENVIDHAESLAGALQSPGWRMWKDTPHAD